MPFFYFNWIVAPLFSYFYLIELIHPFSFIFTQFSLLFVFLFLSSWIDTHFFSYFYSIFVPLFSYFYLVELIRPFSLIFTQFSRLFIFLILFRYALFLFFFCWVVQPPFLIFIVPLSCFLFSIKLNCLTLFLLFLLDTQNFPFFVGSSHIFHLILSYFIFTNHHLSLCYTFVY